MTKKAFIKSISIKGEEWKDVVGFEGSYLISSFGRVISLKRKSPFLLKPKTSKEGYRDVVLYLHGNKTYVHVHRLVAIAFIANPENKPQVDHIDRNRANNHISNLRWCTCSENMRNPLTIEVLRPINKGRERLNMHKPVVCLKDGILVHEFYKMNLCENFGFERSSVAKCCKHKKKTYKGYTFLYLDEYKQLINTKQSN